MTARIFLTVLATAIFAACQSVTTERARTTGAATTEQGLQAVAGNWKFSHSGPSPVRSEGSADPAKIIAKNLAGSRISIAADGNSSMMAMGQSGTFKVDVLEETPIYLKVGSKDSPFTNPWTYDKTTRLLAVPIDIKSDGSESKMPVYFRRTGR